MTLDKTKTAHPWLARLAKKRNPGGKKEKEKRASVILDKAWVKSHISKTPQIEWKSFGSWEYLVPEGRCSYREGILPGSQ